MSLPPISDHRIVSNLSLPSLDELPSLLSKAASGNPFTFDGKGRRGLVVPVTLDNLARLTGFRIYLSQREERPPPGKAAWEQLVTRVDGIARACLDKSCLAPIEIQFKHDLSSQVMALFSPLDLPCPGTQIPFSRWVQDLTKKPLPHVPFVDEEQKARMLQVAHQTTLDGRQSDLYLGAPPVLNLPNWLLQEAASSLHAKTGRPVWYVSSQAVENTLSDPSQRKSALEGLFQLSHQVQAVVIWDAWDVLITTAPELKARVAALPPDRPRMIFVLRSYPYLPHPQLVMQETPLIRFQCLRGTYPLNKPIQGISISDPILELILDLQLRFSPEKSDPSWTSSRFIDHCIRRHKSKPAYPLQLTRESVVEAFSQLIGAPSLETLQQFAARFDVPRTQAALVRPSVPWDRLIAALVSEFQGKPFSVSLAGPRGGGKSALIELLARAFDRGDIRPAPLQKKRLYYVTQENATELVSKAPQIRAHAIFVIDSSRLPIGPIMEDPLCQKVTTQAGPSPLSIGWQTLFLTGLTPQETVVVLQQTYGGKKVQGGYEVPAQLFQEAIDLAGQSHPADFNPGHTLALIQLTIGRLISQGTPPRPLTLHDLQTTCQLPNPLKRSSAEPVSEEKEPPVKK